MNDIESNILAMQIGGFFKKIKLILDSMTVENYSGSSWGGGRGHCQRFRINDRYTIEVEFDDKESNGMFGKIIKGLFIIDRQFHFSADEPWGNKYFNILEIVSEHCPYGDRKGDVMKMIDDRLKELNVYFKKKSQQTSDTNKILNDLAGYLQGETISVTI
jgi:hypothetical protein